jgi:hypothetical protein
MDRAQALSSLGSFALRERTLSWTGNSYESLNNLDHCGIALHFHFIDSANQGAAAKSKSKPKKRHSG